MELSLFKEIRPKAVSSHPTPLPPVPKDPTPSSPSLPFPPPPPLPDPKDEVQPGEINPLRSFGMQHTGKSIFFKLHLEGLQVNVHVPPLP